MEGVGANYPIRCLGISLSTMEEPAMTEDKLQIGVCKLLDALKLDWFHCPNGGKRNYWTGANLKKMGVKAGVPDVIIINPTRDGSSGLAIELKVGDNKTTSTQEGWRTKFLNNNWTYSVAYSIDDVIHLVSKHYGK
mgnify:FL=1